MARSLDITVVVAPSLRNAFDGRSSVNLGLPASAGVGELVETLLRLYPRTKAMLAGDWGKPGGRYMHLVLDGSLGRDRAPGAGTLAAGHKVFLFALSRPSAGSQADLEG